MILEFLLLLIMLAHPSVLAFVFRCQEDGQSSSSCLRLMADPVSCHLALLTFRDWAKSPLNESTFLSSFPEHPSHYYGE